MGLAAIGQRRPRGALGSLQTASAPKSKFPLPGSYTVSIATAESFSAAIRSADRIRGDAVGQPACSSSNQLLLGGFSSGPSGTGVFQVANGGLVSRSTTTAFVWSGSTLSVDSTSAVDIGTSDIYVPANVNIDAGSTLAGNGLISATVAQ